jgi:CubicO group peptidase (beta-lactamase class C family)
MRWLRRLIPWSIILLVLGVLIYLPDQGPERYTDFPTLFGNEARRLANSGFSVVITKDGRILYAGSFGHDGLGNPLAKDTPMYLGPSSEILSGALLRSLELDRSLNLDEDLGTFLPELPFHGPQSIKDVMKTDDIAVQPANEPPVTLRRIAAHSVDLSSRELAAYRSRISGLEAGELDPEGFLKRRLNEEASPRSRLAYRILGTAMEVASGKRFDELLETRLLIPLGMHGTTARPDSLRGVATGSGFFFSLSFPYSSNVPYIAAPADGIVSTIEDIGKFLAYITSPPMKGILALRPSAVTSLYQPLIAGGSTGYGWRIIDRAGGDRFIFQGGSILGFSSRVVIWPERRTSIAILSAQGGAVQSNLVLPLLSGSAEKLLFSGSAPRLFPYGRVFIVIGVAMLVYVVSLNLQTATAHSWARQLMDRNESGKSGRMKTLIYARTVWGLFFRAALLFSAPLLAGRLVGQSIGLYELMRVEPGVIAMFIIAMLSGMARNFTRIIWLVRMERG